MSFLKISDPLKRDAIVKEYLELKKKIRGNLLSERIGEQQLQTDLSKFYKPITETQKATAREITEELKPIREGIEKLPEAIQPISEATEEKEEDDDKFVGKIAKDYLNMDMELRDKKFGIHKKGIHHYIGKTHVIIKDNVIIIPKTGERLEGTTGLWELIMSKNPQNFTEMDYDNYKYLIIMSNVLHRDDNSANPYPKASGSYKWAFLLGPIWKSKKKEYEGEGVVVIPSDPNALLERLDLLLASQEAGHTGVRNELVSICDELKRQDVLDTKAYKKLNHLIKK